VNHKRKGGDPVQIDFDSERPIFQQIADGLEDAILSGVFPEGSQIPSITEFSVTYKINPATALKGINLLVDENIVYKKRGLGMFVTEGAAEKLRQKRKESFYENFIKAMVEEAKRLEISREELKAMMERGFEG
jgi:GntR family transcriptional regulator